MPAIKLIQLLVVFLAIVGEAQDNRTISDVYVNLPASCADCRKVKYEITAYNGCYDWITLNPQIISLDKISDGTKCFNRASLTAIVSRPIKTVVIIKATDLISKETLVSQVKVSRLSEFRILTNFKAIDVDDVQKLFIQAFDDSNNVISSVEGLRFEWRIETNPHALKVITSKEANYENTPVRLEMEQRHHQTDLILVRGIQTGIVEVSARILEKDYEEVGKARITLFVIEPFFLIPDKPVYLLTNSEFTYRIAKGKRQINGKVSTHYTEVRLPDSQYRFIAGDPRMLSVANSGTVRTKDILGEVLVRVEDTTLVNNTVEGLIYIVDPDMLELSIRDVTTEVSAGVSLTSIQSQADVCDHTRICNWNLVVGHVYAITSCLFDTSKNAITLTPDVTFELTYSDTYLKLLSSNAQRSVIIVKAIAPETRGISLRSVLASKKEFRNRAFADKQLKIFPQVKVDHPLDVIILPYLARTHLSQVPQMWTLSSSGGSGAYKWESANSEVVAATSQGIIFGLRLGSTKVIVSDALNPFNNNTITVEVTRVAQLEWLEEKMELSLNSKDVTSVIAFDERGRKFTNCTEIPLSWSVKDGGIINLRDEGGRQQYDNIKRYVYGQGKELIKLRNSYDKTIFDETRELHNLFGICGQRTLNTLGEGMGRVVTEFSINEEGGIYYKRASPQELILVYKPLNTTNPSYESFLKPLRLDERDISYRRYLQQLKSENEFILAYGSGLLWEIAGGTFSWSDLPGYYSENIQVEKTMGSREIDLQVKSTNGDSIRNSKREHYLECPVPNSAFFSGQTDSEFKLTLKAGNKRAKSLLRPAESVISIVISCQVPQSLKLAWVQRDLTHCESLPRKETGDTYDVDTYFVKNGQVFNTRMLAFDKYRRIFYNFSSCGHEQSTTDSTLGVIRQLDPYYLHELRTTQKTGSFYINGGLVGLNDPRGWKVLDLSKINDKMKINNINILRIEPTYKLLYIHQTNTVTIRLIDGSGSFNIRPNMTGIVDIRYNPTADPRTATIAPLREGYVSVVVEDRGVASSISVSCTIVVSGISKISLRRDQLLEHEKSTKVQIGYQAFNGEPFPLEQYKFIPVNIVASKKRGLPFEDVKGLTITPTAENTPDFYNIYGKEIGSYEVIASVRTGYMPEVYSNPIYIEVFPALKIYPSGLLLLPDGSYTLKMSGGPFSALLDSDKSKFGGNIAKSFQSADPNIVEVNGATGEIKAKRIGDTTIDVILTQEVHDYSTNTIKYETLCKQSIPISIKLATGVEVVGIRKREILSGATIKIVALLKSRNETFTHAVYPVEYSWTSKQPNVFSLHVEEKRDDMINIVQGVQPSVEGTANKPGEADILLHVMITYPEIYKNELHEFSANSVLRVLDPLYGNVPTFIDKPPGQTTTYLIPPKCMHRLPPNKENNMKLTYRQLCTSTNTIYQILSISEENLVTTSEHYGSTAIVVEESSYNPLRTAYYVEVAPIHSVVIHKSSSVLSLPLGADVSLKIVYQDRLGRSFADLVEGIKLNVDISHPGVIRADLDYYNSTLTVRALALGNAMLHIYMEDYILDIIRVQVSSVIDSSTSIFVHIGGTVQFKNLQGYPEAKGWVSDNPSVMKIDSATGLGKALKEGIANVNMDGIARLKLTSGKIKHIALHLESSPKTLTNMVNDPLYKSMYPIQFKLYGDDPNNEIGSTKETTLASVNQRVEFECRSQNPDWVIAKAEDPKGSTVCLIYPKTDSSGTPPSTVNIEVSAGSKEFGYTKTERFSFPFASGFGVIGSKDLVFSKTSRSKTIKVSGSNNIRVWAEDPSLCDIRILSEEGFSEIYVSIPRDIIRDFKNMKLHIQNVQSEQREVVLLSYYNSDFDPEDDNKKGWRLTDLLAFIIMIVTIIVIIKYACFNGTPAQSPGYYPQQSYRYRQPTEYNYGNRGFNTSNMFSTFIK